MKLLPIQTPMILNGDNLAEIINKSLREFGKSPKNRDILVVASKVVSISEGKLVNIDDVESTPEAVKLARRYALDSRFAQVILDEAEEVYWGVFGAVLTKKNGILTANSGVDLKNAPPSCAVLWPENADESARRISSQLSKAAGANIPVVIVDSRVNPLRLGTTGIAIGAWGIPWVVDLRGEPDLSGRRLRITTHSIADNLASAAHLVMGEASEQTPVVLVENHGLDAAYRRISSAIIGERECLYWSGITRLKS